MEAPGPITDQEALQDLINFIAENANNVHEEFATLMACAGQLIDIAISLNDYVDSDKIIDEMMNKVTEMRKTNFPQRNWVEMNIKDL